MENESRSSHKWLAGFGMAGVIIFIAMDMFGSASWKGYNPVSTYVSSLVLTEAPNHQINRFLMNTYNIFYLFFALAAMGYSFRRFNIIVRIGHFLLFTAGLLSTVGYGSYPISIILLYVKNDIQHISFTITLLILTTLALFITGFGYLAQKNLRWFGTITVIAGFTFTVLNLWHIYGITYGSGILGLIERLTFYTFHAFTFYASWVYAFRLKWPITGKRINGRTVRPAV